MGYNVLDLVNKSMKVAIWKKAIYESLGQRKCDITSIEIMSKVLAKEIDRTIKYYEELKNEVSEAKFPWYQA